MWYLDNGANNHMIEDRTKFKALDEKLIGNVIFSDGSIVPIQGKGIHLVQVQKWRQRLLNKG